VKHFWLIALFILAAVLPLHAQTNAAASETATNKTQIAPQPSRGPTLIDSDSAHFDMAAHRAVYRGHVRVDDPQMKLTCALLTADLPQNGGRVNHIVAETNVVIDFTDEKGQTSHATGDKAVYDYQMQNGVTNETVTLTGNPQVEDAQGTQAGDVITWDRANNGFQFINPHMIFRQSFTGASAETNSPATTTNNLPAPE
jgi:lipopolysaccharide transport protein LptA